MGWSTRRGNSLQLVNTGLGHSRPVLSASEDPESVSLEAHVVKNLSAMWETGVLLWAGETSLEEEAAAHSSISAWRIPWTEEPGGLQSMRSQRVRCD